MDVEEAGQVFVTPAAYADPSWFHEACAVLRGKDPIHLVESDEYPTFYALTKHADVQEASLHPAVFRNTPRPFLNDLARERAQQEAGGLLRTLIHMDEPEHHEYRALTADWFKPRRLAQLDDRIAVRARAAVDRMVELGGECDFVSDVAVDYPLRVILTILGLPESDYPVMLKLTQELFGLEDPDHARGSAVEDMLAVVYEFFEYFNQLTEDRRANPTDDLASVIANATVNGERIGVLELLGYYVIIATAGHDTTSSALSGGIEMLANCPDQLERLQGDPTLTDTAVDEMVRWTSPVRQFMRNVAEPYVLRDHQFIPGDAVLLSYPSANRDEDVFEQPFEFDVGRSPNPHLGFGIGAHFCLGAKLARMELGAFLRELIPRLDVLELAGESALTHALFVGGHKRLPLRYSLR